MSGIVGILNLDQSPVDLAQLSRMTDAIRHRGPDGAGHWLSGDVGLGQCMLHTTPESLNERQPLTDRSGNLCLVMDGRVDNREELKSALESKRAVVRSDTDAELVLAAYAHWGQECPARIIGDFAFAIWDGYNRQLFCARDPLGIRPFYYLHLPGRRFVFASEMEPLFAGGELPRKPNLKLMARYLGACYDEVEETLYEGILHLPARHCICLSSSSVRKVRYWDVDPGRTIRYRTDEEYAEHFRDLFDEAVRCRLRSQRPVGLQLSGGLDSSSIVCTAAALARASKVLAPRFETLSLLFSGLSCDEGAYIREVGEVAGCPVNLSDHTTLDPDWLRLDQLGRYPGLLFGFTDVMFAPMLSTMQSRGFRVILEGCGGDELFEGDIEHLTDLFRAGHIRQLARQLPPMARGNDTSVCSLLTQCLRPAVPNAARSALRQLRRRLGQQPGRPVLLTPEYARPDRLADRAARAADASALPASSQRAIYEVLFGAWNATVALPNHDLFLSRFSLEFRRPFSDRRLVEFMLALPHEQIAADGRPKGLLRRAMAGRLPEKVRQRRDKAEFSPVLDLEMKCRQAQAIEGLLREPVLADLGLVDRNSAWRLFDEYRRSESGHLAGRAQLLLGLESWCRQALAIPLIPNQRRKHDEHEVRPKERGQVCQAV